MTNTSAPQVPTFSSVVKVGGTIMRVGSLAWDALAESCHGDLVTIDGALVRVGSGVWKRIEAQVEVQERMLAEAQDRMLADLLR